MATAPGESRKGLITYLHVCLLIPAEYGDSAALGIFSIYRGRGDPDYGLILSIGFGESRKSLTTDLPIYHGFTCTHPADA